MQSSSIVERDKWGIFKNWLEDNQADIVLVIGVILIALISFGLGRLSAPKGNKEPVIIEQNQELGTKNNDASILNNLEQGSDNAQNNPSTSAATGDLRPWNSDSAETAVSAKGIFVVSKNGTKYHWPWCSFAKKIKPENQVWFQTEVEAQKAGYSACGCIAKSPPAGYKADLTK